jgi:hypothetical protein
MSLQGLQATAEEGIGSFSVQAVRMDGAALAQAAAQSSSSSSGEATSLSYLAGGSSSSYTYAINSAGYPYKWTQAEPKVQLYLKADTVPSNLNQEDVRSAISAAANTWDDAVAKNLFADGTTVISDSGKSIDTRDGYNVNAWKYLSDAPSALAYCRTWSGGPIVNGFYSAIESDVSYNTNWAWSTSGGNYDVQSVATHELGHTIGLGDIYSTTYGGTLPPSDPRTSDYEQVMNLYDGPQRTLGNGDRAGAQSLYGTPSFNPVPLSGGKPVSTASGAIGLFGSGIWHLDSNGNRIYDAEDITATFGVSSDLPVVGDWIGDGQAKIGVFQPSTGTWYLDNSGNGAFDAGDVSSYFGGSIDLPVAGDWDGDGKTNVGVFRSSTGTWYLDYNGNGGWGAGDVSSYFGGSIDLPVAGDWNGDGAANIGVFRSSTGTWYLDNSGNGGWGVGDVSAFFG